MAAPANQTGYQAPMGLSGADPSSHPKPPPAPTVEAAALTEEERCLEILSALGLLPPSSPESGAAGSEGSEKHRLKQRKAKQGGQCQGNASTKPVSELIIAGHNEAISESITPGVAANSELYPLRLQTQAKKRPVEAVVLKTYSYTCSSGIYRKTQSVWDEYEKNLQKEFFGSNKRWLSSSLYQCPPKNKVFISDEGVPNEPNKTAGDIGYGASTSSGVSSLLTINQVGENNRIGANRENNNVGSIYLLEGEIGYGACIENFGSGSLLTSDKEGEINPTEVARETDNLGNINLLA